MAIAFDSYDIIELITYLQRFLYLLSYGGDVSQLCVKLGATTQFCWFHICFVRSQATNFHRCFVSLVQWHPISSTTIFVSHKYRLIRPFMLSLHFKLGTVLDLECFSYIYLIANRLLDTIQYTSGLLHLLSYLR